MIYLMVHSLYIQHCMDLQLAVDMVDPYKRRVGYSFESTRPKTNSAQTKSAQNQLGPKPSRPKTNSAQNSLGQSRHWITRSFSSLLLFPLFFFFFFFHHLYYLCTGNFGNLERCNFQTVTVMWILFGMGTSQRIHFWYWSGITKSADFFPGNENK